MLVKEDRSDDGDQDEAASSRYWGRGEPPGEPTSAEEYRADMLEIVHEFAPRRFAVVQDWGDNVDGRVAAWGLAFPDEIQIIDDAHNVHRVISGVDKAIARYTRPPYLTAWIHWIDPEPEPADV